MGMCVCGLRGMYEWVCVCGLTGMYVWVCVCGLRGMWFVCVRALVCLCCARLCVCVGGLWCRPVHVEGTSVRAHCALHL